MAKEVTPEERDAAAARKNDRDKAESTERKQDLTAIEKKIDEELAKLDEPIAKNSPKKQLQKDLSGEPSTNVRAEAANVEEPRTPTLVDRIRAALARLRTRFNQGNEEGTQSRSPANQSRPGTEIQDEFSRLDSADQSVFNRIYMYLPTDFANPLLTTLSVPDIHRFAKLSDKYQRRLYGMTELAIAAASRPDGSVANMIGELGAMSPNQRAEELTRMLPTVPAGKREAAFQDLQGLNESERGPLARMASFAQPVSLGLSQQDVRDYRSQLTDPRIREHFDNLNLRIQRIVVRSVTPSEAMRFFGLSIPQERITESMLVGLAADALGQSTEQAAAQLKRDPTAIRNAYRTPFFQSLQRDSGISTGDMNRPTAMIDRVLAVPQEDRRIIQKVAKALYANDAHVSLRRT